MTDAFETHIVRKMERLTYQSYRSLEADSAHKRRVWYQHHVKDMGRTIPSSPRAAYELFFFEFLGLSAEDVPVLAETDDEITWSSVNPCDTLEACRRLGLDTRVVCRAVYEKSTQVFFSQIDPQLRFLRSYQDIRPHSHHCREKIVRVDFAQMMGRALEEALLSKTEGNKGYGAVVALGNQVIGKAHDTAITEGDPSLHAEMNAIRQAVKALQNPDLSGAVLFSTCEPCPMCTSLAIWANLTTIVYGASIEATIRFGRTRINLSATDIIQRAPVMVEVIGGVLQEACEALYQGDTLPQG